MEFGAGAAALNQQRRPRDQPTVSGPDGLRPQRRSLDAVTPREAGVKLHREHARTVQIELRPETRYLIGRHEGVDVVFESSDVSRTHGALFCEEGRWCYQDMGSSNGSAVLTREEVARGREGQPAPLAPMEKVALDIGDQVLIGGWASRIELCPPLAFDAVVDEGEVGAGGIDADDDGIRSAAGRDFDDKIELAARTRVPVFIAGASGTGKTHAARQIHVRGTPEAPFVLVSCARLPSDPTQLHSELLGHVKGAFAGAVADRIGALHAADGGTLCLDEIESLSPAAQGFLLDLLEGTGDPSPLGATTTRPPSPRFRLIAAAKVALGESGLRPDLCERLLEGHVLRVPHVAERREDVPALLSRFAREQSKMLGVDVSFTEEALAFATSAEWPGEIRQLRAAVTVLAQAAVAQRAPATAFSARKRPGILLRADDMRRHVSERQAVFTRPAVVPSPSALPTAAPPLPVKRFSRSLTKEDVAEALRRADGNQSEAARLLGIARNTLIKKVKDFDL